MSRGSIGAGAGGGAAGSAGGGAFFATPSSIGSRTGSSKPGIANGLRTPRREVPRHTSTPLFYDFWPSRTMYEGPFRNQFPSRHDKAGRLFSEWRTHPGGGATMTRQRWAVAVLAAVLAA